MKIFLSYGHDEYEKIAERLKVDLEKEGFEVWIDKAEIKGGADWEINIETGISTSDWLVLLMTKHSVRRPDGVCLDEVSYARFMGKKIAPIMIQEVKPPLCIARIQWIDMKDFFVPEKNYFTENAYQTKKEELLSILKGVRSLGMEGEYKSINTKLRPLDNDVYSEHFSQNFFGRKKLIDYYDKWHLSDKRVLWLVGDAGVGKTAFIANLCSIRGDIQAVHFCRYNDNERADPKRAIMSIAYYLATQIPEYQQILLDMQDMDNLIEKNTRRLFEYLIAEPLHKVTYNEKPIVIVIDALDEATLDGRNELADVISECFEKTPKWVKLLLTSRKEPLLERKLAKFKPINFADSSIYDNEEDIKGYFSFQLKAYLPNGKKGQVILNKMVEKSNGIFLYAKAIVDEILSGQLTVNNIDYFPEGLSGVYYNYFERIFGEERKISYKNDVRPVMEVLCATCAPLSATMMCDILEMDEYEFQEICDLICEMFPTRNGVIVPIHKSIIDWLIDPQKSGSYRVSVKKGHSKIANHLLSKCQNRNWTNYALQYLCLHLLAEEKTEGITNLLCDSDYLNKRISFMGVDSAIRETLLEIEKLYTINVDATHKVMQGCAFTNLFAQYRKFFYNSGLYFQLKRCDFDSFLAINDMSSSVNGQIGIAYYYYITENFNNAICVINKILADQNLRKVEKAELYNVLALCYRKNVDFDKAKENFIFAFKVEEETEEYYNRSISLINLGKIAYHELNWDEADSWNKQGIDYLKKELAISTNNDYQISIKLFIAEYHRLCAEYLIWKGDLKRADEELAQAYETYRKIQSRDRYYIRFLYTSVFRDILAGKYAEVFEDCELLLQQATSLYDKSQILFYRGIAAFKLNLTESFRECVECAYKYAKTIGAWLELEEIVLLSTFVELPDIKLEHSNIYATNKTLKNWIKYVSEFIDRC